MHRSEWLARLLRCYKATIDLLERVRQEAGYPYKDVTRVDLADYKPAPCWFGGAVEVGYNNEPEAIAHELAHGLHEKVREAGRPDCLGEEFAEAIRFYVETEMRTGSSWLRSFAKAENPFTRRYTLEQFIGALRSGDLFQDVGWRR
jgi:hypothetical protein